MASGAGSTMVADGSSNVSQGPQQFQDTTGQAVRALLCAIRLYRLFHHAGMIPEGYNPAWWEALFSTAAPRFQGRIDAKGGVSLAESDSAPRGAAGRRGQ